MTGSKSSDGPVSILVTLNVGVTPVTTIHTKYYSAAPRTHDLCRSLWTAYITFVNIFVSFMQTQYLDLALST